MTPEEALKVTRIMCFADGERYICARTLLKDFVATFPEHEKSALQAYKEEHRRDNLEDDD